MIEYIRTNYADCIRTRCSENNCKLDTRSINDHIILKGELTRDKKGESFNICDYIIFHEEYVILVELKGKSSAKPTKIVKQLEGCTKIALKILNECSRNYRDHKFVHISLAKRWKSSKFDLMKSKSVWVNGQKHEIFVGTSGFNVARLLN